MLSQFFSWILGSFFGGRPSDDEGTDDDLVQKGLFFRIKKLIYLFLLKKVCSPPPKKAGDFRPMKEGIERSGFMATPEETETDNPKKLSDKPYCERDEVSFYGGNSHGDCLWLDFINYSSTRGEVVLVLQLADGRRFTYNHHPSTYAITDGFNSGPLRVECTSPFRKWRLSFNGRLRQTGEISKLVYIRFSLWFSPTQFLYNVASDTHPTMVADCLAQDHCKSPYHKVKRFYESVEIYEQWGMYLGTVKVADEEENELNLWGLRIRDRTNYKMDEIEGFTRYYGRLKRGQVFGAGAISFGDLIKNFKYGYAIFPNRDIRPLVSSNIKLSTGSKDLVKVAVICTEMERQRWQLEPLDQITTLHGKMWELTSTFTICKYYHEGKEGYGCVHQVYRTRPDANLQPPPWPPEPVKERAFSTLTTPVPLVATFEEEACQCPDVAGGKGASLALLYKLAARDKSFQVPRGVVLTTSCYRTHLMEFPHLLAQIHDLQKNIGGLDVHALKDKCNRVAGEFKNTKMVAHVVKAVKEGLISLFGDDLDSVRLAVRSSAIGEDSEETSAAGQMVTFLGVRGLDNVCDSISRCWASQFLLTAVQYKRQNGIPLDPGMAVVIQEMVPADKAGVTFTCDPVTGDPSFITITANYGLGESVVSASVEPDTIRLTRNDDESLTVDSILVGKKDHRITMAEGDWTLAEKLGEEEANACCLPEELALRLGKIALRIEEAFNSCRDIEWAVVGETIYMLQSRPVTTLHRESDYDILHEFDVGLNSDFEYWTRANVGEVMPGALSPMTFSLYFTGIEIAFPDDKKEETGQEFIINPYAHPFLAYHAGHAFISILDLILRFVNRSTKLSQRTWEIAIFGRLLDEFYRELAIERNGITEMPKISAIRTLWNSIKINRKAQRYIKTVPFIDGSRFRSSKDLYDEITRKLPYLFKSLFYHAENTETSSTFNNIILENLADHYGGNINEMMKDVALMLSSCSNLESADVPSSLEALASKIAKSDFREHFINMDAKDAVKFLREDKGPVGAAYSDFIQRHSHRCFKEFDFAILPWGDNPENLVTSIQQIVRNKKQADEHPKRIIGAWESVSSLKYKPSLPEKLKFWFLVHCARYGVRIREESKSMIIKVLDIYRKPLRHLGRLLMQEGKLPEPQLVFFLSYDELTHLIGNFSTKLVNKARRRQRVFAQADKFKFPEIVEGVPKPITAKKPKIDGKSVASLKGVTVSQGVTRGVARVIMDFEECNQIQQDDILITYSTDIGWSPYFPLLSGVVTEIGGLVSHGAVVAREYGLPCLVGVEGATAVFKSGDYVILDANQGVIKKVDVNALNGS